MKKFTFVLTVLVLFVLVIFIMEAHRQKDLEREIDADYAQAFGEGAAEIEAEATADKREAASWWDKYSPADQASICQRYANDRDGVLTEIDQGGADDYVTDPKVFEHLLDHSCD